MNRLSALHPPSANPHAARSVIDTIGAAEALLAQGASKDAIELYREWLKQGPSPVDWAAQFNLGILLQNSGNLEGAR